jgi:hypothetical protein
MNSHAREYILRELRGMGLQPQVQTATVHTQEMDKGHNVHVTLAVVHNIVVRMPGVARGHASRPALLVASHYDSDANSLGAADGAASSAAMIETLRALQASPPLEDDVLFLFTDAGKVRELGEQAFVQQHPDAKHIRLALKFSNLGNLGPLWLYDTHGAAGDAIIRWASAAPQPHGSSFMRELHRLTGPGIGPLAAIGAPVLQLAPVQGRLDIYDTPGRLDRAGLQHEGDTMLALVREFSRRPTQGAARQRDLSWFHLPLLGIVLYPAWIAWTATALACLLLASACRTACRQTQVELRDVVAGAYRFALAALAPAALLFFVGPYASIFDLGRDAASGLPDMPRLAAGAALLTALSIVLLRRVLKSCGAHAAALGAFVTIAVLLVLTTLALPGASCLLAWPLLAAAAAFADQQARGATVSTAALRLTLLTAGLAPALMLILPALRDALAVPDAPRQLLAAVLLALLLGLASPLLALVARRFFARGFLLAGLGLLALPGSASAPTAQPPVPNPLVYYKDMPTWSEWWLARDPVLDQSSRSIFAAQPKPRRLVDVFGWDSDDLWYARAPDSEEVSFPHAIQLVNEPFPQRRIVFDLASKNSAPNIELRLRGGKPWRASVNGMEITNDDQIRNWSLSLYGMEDKTLHFELDMVGDPYLGVQVEEHIPGVPSHLLRPPARTGQFIPATGQTITTDTMWFR